jgi:hypothetical protein
VGHAPARRAHPPAVSITGAELRDLVAHSAVLDRDERS